MKIEKDAEKILEEFSKTLNSIPNLEETHYIVDNVNLVRKDVSHEKNPEKIMKNAKTDKDGNVIVKKADWIN
jgi:aspartyl-tRNA(Asn)/glutamyl-tRNA(Gln) amidotransferase subunit C